MNMWNSKRAFTFRQRWKNIIMLLLPMAFIKISQEILGFSFILDRWVTCLKWRPSQYSPGSDSIQLRPVSTSRLAFTQPPHPANYINKKRVSKQHFVFIYKHLKQFQIYAGLKWVWYPVRHGFTSEKPSIYCVSTRNVVSSNWKGLREK